MMGQIMENIETDFPTVKFLKVDVDKFPEITAKFNISSIPDMYFFKDGKKIEVDSDGEKRMTCSVPDPRRHSVTS